MRVRLVAALLLAVLAIAGPAQAQVLEDRASGTTRVTGDHPATEGAALDFSWDAEVRLGLLMGEPVVSVRFRWDRVVGIVTLPELTPGGRRYAPVQLTELPEDLRDRPRLIDLDLRITLSSGGSLYDLVADVGASAGPGEWSFNVPGSPDWDAVLFYHQSNETLSADAARAAFRDGLSLVSVRLERAELSLFDLHERYTGRYGARERYRALGAAYERLLDGLSRSYGIDAAGIAGGWTDAYFVAENTGRLSSPADWEERLRDLRATLDKLSSLPDALRAGRNHGPYDQAVRDAALIDRAAQASLRDFTPEGADPAARPAGRPPEFRDGSPPPEPRILYRFTRENFDRTPFAIVWKDNHYVILSGGELHRERVYDGVVYQFYHIPHVGAVRVSTYFEDCDGAGRARFSEHIQVDCPVPYGELVLVPLFDGRLSVTQPFHYDRRTGTGSRKPVDEIGDDEFVYYGLNGFAMFELGPRQGDRREWRRAHVYELAPVTGGSASGFRLSDIRDCKPGTSFSNFAGCLH